jgi:hypothetical protein
VPTSALRRQADADRPTPAANAARPAPRPGRSPSLRIVLAQGPAPAHDAASVARVVRHGPPDAIGVGAKVRHPSIEAVFARARSLWPGLDARALARTQGDVRRVARLVGRRTALPEDTIIAMLTAER